jgi:magnesium transporter
MPRKSLKDKLRQKNGRLEVFKSIPLKQQGRVLAEISKPMRKEILGKLSINEIVEAINFLDPEKISEVIQQVGFIRRKKVLNLVSKNVSEKIEVLFKFDPQNSKNLMSMDYINVDGSMTMEAIAKELFKYEKRNGKVPTILITEKGKIIGELGVHYFALAGLKRKRSKVYKFAKKVPCIRYNSDDHKIIGTLKKHTRGKIVVLDDNESILGIIHSNDISKIIEKQSAKSLRKFAGVHREEDLEDPAITKVHYRYKWLIINLFTAFLAASVVGLFEGTISKMVLLAAYLPIVAGMGGNAATQTLAVTVRGIALNEVNKENAKKIVANEAIAGVVNGAITGIIAGAIAYFWNQSYLLGLVLCFSMIINLFVAGFFGTVIPLFMKKIGKDPASSATIFITSCTDVCGFLVFLGMAKLLLV